jgi:hypothetical protein
MIGDLGRMRKRSGDGLTVSVTAIPSDNRNLLTPLEPGHGRCRFAIR